jgi:hypothetical protein
MPMKLAYAILCRQNTDILNVGRASRRLATAAARLRAQVRSCGICCRQSCTGVVSLRVLRFPLLILIPPIAPHSSSSSSSSTIIRGWYNGQLVARVPSGLSLTPPQETKKTKLRNVTEVVSVVMVLLNCTSELDS